MIRSIEFENSLGAVLKLDLSSIESSSGLWVKSIKGLGPGKADIHVTDLASSDGGIYNSSRSQTRNITLTLGVVDYGAGKTYKSVEDNRRNSYKWFGKKNSLRITVNTDKISLYTDGYVESNEPDIFNKQETMSISIICPDPNWYNKTGGQIIEFSSADDEFEFPMEFEVTLDNPFVEGKTYYEYDEDNHIHFITKDEQRVGGKTYYLEKTYHTEDMSIYEVLVDDEGLSNESVDKLAEWSVSTDTEFLPGMEYYEKTFFETEDSSFDPNKDYYEKIGEQYVLTEDESMDPNKTYYETNNIYYLTNDFTFQNGKTYYKYLNLIEFAELLDIVEKSIKYDGEVETGITITVSIFDEVVGLKFYKLDTEETLEIDDSLIDGGLGSGDTITISTINGNKYASLLRNGSYINILNALGKNPDWFKLHKGESNVFSYSADTGEDKISVTISYILAYEGI